MTRALRHQRQRRARAAEPPVRAGQLLRLLAPHPPRRLPAFPEALPPYHPVSPLQPAAVTAMVGPAAVQTVKDRTRSHDALVSTAASRCVPAARLSPRPVACAQGAAEHLTAAGAYLCPGLHREHEHASSQMLVVGEGACRRGGGGALGCRERGGSDRRNCRRRVGGGRGSCKRTFEAG